MQNIRYFFSTKLWLLSFIMLLGMFTAKLAYTAIPAEKSAPAFQFLPNQLLIGFYDSFMYIDIPHPPSPIFWKANVTVDSGLQLMYLRTTYHTARHFSIQLGLSASYWVKQNESIGAFSGVIMFKFWLWDWKYVHPYILYSIAGPTLLTQNHFGGTNLGKIFLFQDILGIGAQIGNKRALTVSLMIIHYSNGDIFAENTGFGVPIAFTLGYAFP